MNYKTLAIAAVTLAVTANMAFAQGGGRGLLSGKISAIDTTANTVTIASTNGDADQTFTVTKDTVVMTSVTSKTSDLKVGDRIQVSGTPSEITAVSITSGGVGAGGGAGRPAGGGQPGGNAGGGGGGFGGRGGQGGGGFGGGEARISGKVTSVSPLKISTDTGDPVIVKTAADTKVSKIVTSNANTLKIGQTITAFGMPGDDGSVTAMRVFVGDIGAMGFGGRGGRGGQGFGGRGGRGGRGGQGGGQGFGGGGNAGGDAPMDAPQVN